MKYRIFDEICLRGPAAIHDGDVIIDGGSHLGTFTRFALDRRARLVVAFEPDSVSAACFRKTFQREIAQGRVILIEAALWERPGRLSFTPGQTSINSAVSPGNGGDPANRTEVDATTIDESVDKLKLERVDFIKFNVEGAEKEALAGARRTIRRFRPRVLLSLDHGSEDPVAIPQLLKRIVPAYQIRMRGCEQACFY
jgi:FkbM family methyltransferase